MIKRLFDLFASILGLLILSPIILIVAAISIIFQGFPILFHHERLGRNGQPFTMVKFRTMSNGNSLSAKHDITRLTACGRVLRRTSIDELPVLFNVIKGEMSLVGPRPMPTKYLPRFNKSQIKRLIVKPGITGLAQVTGRNSLSWEERFGLDVQYVKNNSFKGDCYIILKTLIIVLKGKDVMATNQEIMPEFMGSRNLEQE
ncbi:MAG: sugar transferase [Candidatus Marinimicrobia bacterium]|nr:sugar transferase [Candidatus Neomarinimicrobiota bacterium]MBT4382843.1 sugar transferase [Candidatus Neomarinimicrobiota bacterium]MBT6391711.1 sugar transferase [Candidatus Neomarinimicrobiota bacterium]MBT6781748.1 sugar transferase [Candidatus Neomarinimicrobiota bacterium]